MANAPLVLDGRWVRLEPLALAHVAPLSRVALDSDLWRWTVSQVGTGEDLRRYVDAALAAAAQGHAVPFAILDRASGAAAGSTRFGNIDPQHRRVEIGWTWLGRAFQRTALNTETKYLMLRHAFERLGCIRVEFKTDVLNTRSREAIRRLGAVEEGVLRHHMITESGRVRDTVYYSILAAEWPAVRERLEARLAR